MSPNEATASNDADEPGIRALEVFVGTWRTEGEIDFGDGAVGRLIATDTYEWMPGGHFLLHRVEGRMGDDEVQALEIIGYDSERGTCFSHSYDNVGNVAAYEATLHGLDWSIVGETERFSGRFSEDGETLTGEWERLEDGGEWTAWMAIRLTKTS